MNTAIEMVGYGAVVPALVAMAIFALSGKLLPLDLFQRYAAATAISAGFLAGYALMPWTEFVPSRHWQWLPYVGLLAAILGPVGLASGAHWFERLLLRIVLAIIAAWLLVPTWPTLSPARPVCIALLSSYMVLLTVILESLPGHFAGRRLLVFVAVLSFFTSVAIAIGVSLLYGQLAGMVTAAMSGCLVASVFTDKLVYRGMISVYVVLVGGVAFVGCIGPEPPLVEFLIIPAAATLLWLFARGPLARLGSTRVMVVTQTVVLLLPVVIVLIRLIGPMIGTGEDATE